MSSTADQRGAPLAVGLVESLSPVRLSSVRRPSVRPVGRQSSAESWLKTCRAARSTPRGHAGQLVMVNDD